MKHNLTVGQILYEKATFQKKLIVKENVIENIGNKYFKINRSKCKFNISNLQYTSDRSSFNRQLYLTKQEILDEFEYEKLLYRLRAYFSAYNKINITLPQLRTISLLIFKDNL